MESNPWALFVVCVSLGATTVATPASGASPPVAVEQNARRTPGGVFRDCEVCPEMVVMAGAELALGRYEVTVAEYRAFAAATGNGGDDCLLVESWRTPGFPQTDRHPVACVSWNDAQAYVSWLSGRTGAQYRLPSEVEWDGAAAGSQAGCHRGRTGSSIPCPVGSYGSNPAGLSDMVANVWEWTSDCWEGDCGRRLLRGGAWDIEAWNLRPGLRHGLTADTRYPFIGFRVSRTLD